MKTRLSLRRINSAACGNLREPRGCCVTHSFTFGFTTRFLQNATEESYRNKAIQACLPSCNSVQYLNPPQTLFVGGILFSRCLSVRPCIRPCIRLSIMLCFLNNSKSHCWIFIKPCKHVHICKTNTLDKKVRARGQFS